MIQINRIASKVDKKEGITLIYEIQTKKYCFSKTQFQIEGILFKINNKQQIYKTNRFKI